MNSCYNCGYVMDAQTHVGQPEIIPKNGDISICLACTALGEFQDEKIVPLSAEKRLHLIENEPEVWNLLLRTQELIRNEQ